MRKVSLPMSRVDCPSCGIITYLPDNFVQAKKENGQNFFCPNGHQLVMLAPPENVKDLKAELKAAKQDVAGLRTENSQLYHRLDQAEARLGCIVE